jgi:hypothetical protein
MVEFENSAVLPTSPDGATDINPIAPKKKRNLPGMPDPDAEVIALSPKTLMATNRFVCEICSKGFQRDQNLQLHRRGHNLPWKLKQRASKEIRKRVYVCPESTCVHHDPSRALGDLTGIKKHFSRKHGEKKWKCERCSKKYAVQSDWKAHMKTCGTREYRCDCGTLFSRRDSFITHRAFCDALAQESERSHTLAVANPNGTFMAQPVPPAAASSPPPPPLTPSASVLSPVMSIQSSDLQHAQCTELPENPATGVSQPAAGTGGSRSSSSSGNVSRSSGIFASIFGATVPVAASQSSQSPSSYSDLLCATAGEPMSLSLASSLYLSNTASIFPSQEQDQRQHYSPSGPVLSATALLQKAAQMGSTTSNSSFLHGLGFTPADHIPDNKTVNNNTQTAEEHRSSMQCGLGLRLDGVSSYPDLMMGPSALFPNRPTTLDLLGIGSRATGGTRNDFSDFFTSISSGLDVSGVSFGVNGGSGENWEDAGDRKPELL